jgi:repressor LexA
MVGEGLHPRKLGILRYLARRRREEPEAGPPSVREVGEAVGLRSAESAHRHVRELEGMGYLLRGEARGRTKPRPLRLTEAGWAAVGTAPLLGRVSAGSGIEAIADEEAYPLAAELLAGRSGRRRFMLRASGRSMVGAGIEDGDLLVFEEDESPDDGEVVAALVNGDEDAIVKRLFREGETVRLAAANEGYEDVLAPAGEVRVQGALVWVIHRARGRAGR